MATQQALVPDRPARGSTTAEGAFSLVLAGGGARGLAHVGALRALEHAGLRPGAIVGVSMGAIVGATYGLNADWYRALLGIDLNRIPGLARTSGNRSAARLRRLLQAGRSLRQLITRWGALTPDADVILELLEELTLGKGLEASTTPIAVVATALGAGRRVILREGNAAQAVYASAALAGVLPPARQGGDLLVDGAYADLAPVDVARQLVDGPVVVVNPSPKADPPAPRNGLQVLLRAMEISYRQHALTRFAQADVEIVVRFPRPIATTDFSDLRSNVAAGARAIRTQLPAIIAALADTRPLAAGSEPHQPHHPTSASANRTKSSAST